MNPLVVWIWLGGLILAIGTAVAMWPTAGARGARAGAWRGAGRGGVTAARAAALLLLAVALSACGVAQAPTQQEIEESLTCQCGCGLTVHSCNHLKCPSGEPMKRRSPSASARGESTDQVLAAFTARYGEKVLSSPTFRGFNWLAWVTPFARGADRGRRARRRHPASCPDDRGRRAVRWRRGAEGDPALRARLARELDDLDRD